MGTVYRARRSRMIGSFIKAVVIVLAVMLFWGTFLWVGLDMHLPRTVRQTEEAAVTAEADLPAAEGGQVIVELDT